MRIDQNKKRLLSLGIGVPDQKKIEKKRDKSLKKKEIMRQKAQRARLELQNASKPCLIITLNGLIHTNEHIAFQEINRQLFESHNVEYANCRNFATNLRILVESLKEAKGVQRPIVFVLEEFQAFAAKLSNPIVYALWMCSSRVMHSSSSSESRMSSILWSLSKRGFAQGFRTDRFSSLSSSSRTSLRSFESLLTVPDDVWDDILSARLERQG